MSYGEFKNGSKYIVSVHIKSCHGILLRIVLYLVSHYFKKEFPLENQSFFFVAIIFYYSIPIPWRC